jgi:hypothetical protein
VSEAAPRPASIVRQYDPGSAKPTEAKTQSIRYAVFPETRRLVIDFGRDHTGSRRIFGVAHEPSFTSQGAGLGRLPAEVAA